MKVERTKWLSVWRLCRHCTLLYGFVLLVLLPLTSFKLKHSKYFVSTQDVLQRQLSQSNKDDNLAEEDLQSLWRRRNSTKSFLGSKCTGNNRTDIVVAIITKKRSALLDGKIRTARYLTRVINTVFRAADYASTRLENEFSFCSSSVIICNANSDRNEEVDLLKAFVTVHELNAERFSWTIRQETADYRSCLQYLKSSVDSNYYFVLEDDALPRDEMFYVFHRLVHENFDDASSHEDFFYMKLYHPDKLASYIRNPELYQFVEWFAMGIMFGFFTTLLYRRCIERHMSVCMLLTVFVLTGALAMLSVELFGRVYLLELRRLHWQLYSVAPAPGCCTPAMVFTRNSLSAAISSLQVEEASVKPLDFILYNYALHHSKRIWLLEPSLVTHIGMISSVRQRVLDPHIV